MIILISKVSKVLFVSNGSKDKTWDVICELNKKINYLVELIYQEIEDTKMRW